MASSKITTTLTLTLFLCLNLLLLSTTHAWTPYTPSVPSGGGGGGSSSTPSAPSGGGGGGSSGGPSVPSGGGGGASRGTCPIDALKLGVCANLLGNLLNLQIGTPPVQPCCSLIQGLADLEAAVCLCTVIRANVLNLINLNLPVNLSLLLNVCSRQAPRGFICP